MKQDSLLKFLNDYLPLIVFFACYKLAQTPNPLITATTYMLLTTFMVLVISYFITKKIAFVPLFSGIVLGLFGGLTIFLQNEIFIKMKPTIINLIFAAILFYGFLAKKPLLSYLLEGQIKMSLKAWLKLSNRWAGFFVGLAVLNEIIWRNFSTDFWVQFKVFGMLPLSIAFTLSQVPFMLKEIKKFQVNS